ncbi:4-coumarate--CoA ligase 1-like [Belonocnema kinseyi]|uniref:4-coumarate--CoA ligase 1-like n=1 Tax=Belonocnema kinseyi TaxID=2817044 RepID=UPI00143DD068|nr:4-coumarate--CoA ligase 1-like [Belonocnema kinseyi]
MKNSTNILSGPPLSKNWRYKSAAEFFLELIPKYGTAIAMISVETGEELTYNQILENSLKLALSLKKLGLKVNDRIGICSENNLNFGIAFLSSIFLGTTICPLSPSYTEMELIHTMMISKPKYIFVSISCLPIMRKVVMDLPWFPKLILLYPKASDTDIPNLPDLISKLSDSELRNFKLPEIDKEDHVLLIACSSGTTGLPKGVMLSDKNILIRIQISAEDPASFLKSCKIILGILPMHHTYGICSLLTVLAEGRKLIVLSKFEERVFLETVEKYRIEILLLVPSVLVFLAKSPIVNEYDLSCVKKIISGAAPLSKEIEEIVTKKMKLRAIHSGYGLTESTGILIGSPENHKVNSVGILVPGVQAKVVSLDEKLKEPLGPNMEGELCFKGKNIMKGYCGDEKATKAIIKDGFLHTGDVGYYDEDGYFFIIDRVKELIKYKGFQVPPAELESILLSHNKIGDAAVVGLPDETAGELPLAFVVKLPGVEIRAEEVIEYVNERVSPQKRLRGGVRFINAIPKNPSGKILRKDLRSLLKSKF